MRRRYLAIALPILVALLVAYVAGAAGSAHHAKQAAPKPPPSSQQTTTSRITTPPTTTAALTTTKPRATPSPRATAAAHTTQAVITATRTDCRWRLYHDGAIGTDRSCAPGLINPAVVGHTAQTVCNRAWLASANRLESPPQTKGQLLIEYQLPGNPLTYVAARVIPVEDGGSSTSPLNVYPLPINGWGGQETRTLVADQLHDEICADRITVAQAASMLEGDWLSNGLPDNN